MSTLEITIQYKSSGSWPVICEYISPGDLTIFHEGKLEFGEGYELDLLKNILDPRAYGTILGEALFRGYVRDALCQAIERSQDQLRVLLIVEDDGLNRFHWERLCAPIGPSDRWELLVMDARLLYARFIPSPSSHRFPIIDQQQLRVLAVVVNPPAENEYGLARFDAEEVVRQLDGAWGEDFPHDFLANIPGSPEQPTLANLLAKLLNQPYTCLHIVAHGSFNRKSGETSLFLLDDHGQIDSVLGQRLLDGLNRLDKPGRVPYFIYLEVCESARPEADSTLAFGSLARRLVEDLGVPAVIAMTEKVEIQTAHILTNTFYHSLRSHGQVDLALTEARDAIYGRLNYTVPALFSRLGARPLFVIVESKLSDRDIQHGLERLRGLIPERAPVLASDFEGQAGQVRSKLGIDRSTLHDQELQNWENAYQEIRTICNQVCEMEFSALARDKSVPNYDSRCPFPGLLAFEEQNREFFFGRETLVKNLADRLNQKKFLPILGQSGCGKSSLVKAGIIPWIKRQEPGLEVFAMTPGEEPLSRLNQLAAQIQDNHAIIFIDQFEEVFTQCNSRIQRQAFFDRLLELARQMRLITTMRADFWGDCGNYKQLKEIMQANQELISPLTTPELRLAIEKQAAAVSLLFEANLNHDILTEVEGEPGAMPLIQYLLSEMWERRHGHWLLQTEYDRTGGIKQAVAKSADNIYDHLPKDEQVIMQNIFLRLASPVEGDLSASNRRYTRRRVPLADLIPAGIDEEMVRKLIENLAPRLLVISADQKNETVMVEVAHEALISSWPRLQGWIQTNEDQIRTREEISRAALRWQQSKKRSGELMTGAPLARALEWQKAQRDQHVLNREELEYLNKSKRRVALSRAIVLTVAMATTAIVAAVIALAATGQINPLIYRPIQPDWVSIPAGKFPMGSSEGALVLAGMLESDLPEGAAYILTNETPAHEVELSGYEITRFEITNREYLQCVKANRCNPPENQRFKDKNFASYPMTFVNWQEAQTYCEFIGASLPAEAQWEKAARSLDGRIYPWGNVTDPSKANVFRKELGAMPAGSFPAGDSPYGAADMTGNVWEWVFDWYADYPDQSRPIIDPVGPESGDQRILRGGSYDNDWVQARTTYRYTRLRPGDSAVDVGFRCTRSLAK